MHEVTQQINIHVTELPLIPDTGVGANAGLSQLISFVSQNSINIICIIAVFALIILTFLALKKRSPRTIRATRILATLSTVVILAALSFRIIVPANAGSTLTLDTGTLDVTIMKPNLSVTTADTLNIPDDVLRHDYNVVLDDISDNRITIEINGVAITGTDSLIARKSDNSSHLLNYDINITDDLPLGDYTANLTHYVEDRSEFFSFTIDTRMTDTLDTNPTHYDGTATSFAIPLSGNVGGLSTPAYSWIIDWGDGSPDQTITGVGATTSVGIAHDYASTGGAGEYQITIYSNGIADVGWLNAFGFNTNTTGANVQSNKNMFKSIDSPFTDLMRTPNATNRFMTVFYGARNAVGIPADLFASIDTSSATNVSNMFRQTFNAYAYNSTTAVIPDGLFDSINTSNATNMSNMFNGTFGSFAYNSTIGTIPSGLFSSIDTTNAIDVSSMFSSIFYYYGYGSTIPTTAIIPAGLFDTISTPNATNLYGIFSSAFHGYANTSSVATIPARLFDSIDTSSATNMSSMFQTTFQNYAWNSPTASIPAGLFDTIDTSSATNLYALFNSTFNTYAFSNSTASVPDDLFDSVNLANATNITYMFSSAFFQFAWANTTPTTDINAIWGNANFAGKVDSTIAGTGAFLTSAFYNMKSLTGSAQTFIDTKLGVGLVPDAATQAFRYTQVTDLALLDPNWT